jgi:hypothetical protein
VSGYTPVFDTVFQGTLYGKWPTLPIWLTLLPLADKNGRIDMTPEAISGMTGWPLDILKTGLAELCKPDPRSRSQAEHGARLKLIDECRDWGWVVVNHGKYREKARLAAKAAREVEEGKNRSRMNDRRSPPLTAADPLSNSNSNSNKTLKSERPLETAPEKREAQEALNRIRERIGP